MMWAAILLLSYAAAASAFGARRLAGARWASQSPRLAILAWYVASGSVFAAVALAAGLVLAPGFGIAATAGAFTPSGDGVALGHVWDGGVAALCLAIVAAAACVLGAGAVGVALELVRARRASLRQAQGLALVGVRDPQTGAIEVDHPSAVAYCVAGRRPAVVITSAARRVLGGDELAAVMAHECAHLRGRHHVLTGVSGGLRWGLRFLPLFRSLHAEQARLLEMIADDHAALVAGPQAVASAMLRMAGTQVPAYSLGAADRHAAERVRRLLDGGRGIPMGLRCAIGAGVAAVAFTPILVAAGPIILGASFPWCG